MIEVFYLVFKICYDINRLKCICDEIFTSVQSQQAKYILSFSMISIFITDIYLMLRYYAGSFYNKYIKYKVNIKLDETEFHQNVPVQKIMIHSDADRRSAFIDLRCNSATSHKLAVLFVKEFELIISKFEDYFKNVGLKLYYVTPKIEKSNMTNAIDNYNFEAYIPTLIPLLTGDNIYAKKEVFARELIQNSIDAILVRASANNDFDHTIYITIGQSQEQKFFKIKDFGTGMDRFKIERYFTSIGRSFYSGDEYRDLEIDYKPISNFGIGFLSAFMICREIDVRTKYYLDEQEGLRLHIPNYDGCFFIEKDDTLDIGTEITLYIDKKISHNIQTDKIIEYICDTMQDISCDISINDEINNNRKLLKSRALRRNISSNDILFIPFSNDGKIVENVSLESTIRTNDFIEMYPYGLLVDIARSNRVDTVLNSGIKLYDTDVDDIWCMFNVGTSVTKYLNDFFVFNFPSNYLNIDVSREKITNLNKVSIEDGFKTKLMREILKQLTEYINLCRANTTTNLAINLHFLIMTLVRLCQQDSELSNIHTTLMRMRYELFIRINENSLDLIVSSLNNKPTDAYAYTQNNYSKLQDAFETFVSNNFNRDHQTNFYLQEKNLHKILTEMQELFDKRVRRGRDGLFLRDGFDEYYTYEFFHHDKVYSSIIKCLQKRLKSQDSKVVYAFLVTAAFMLKRNNAKFHMAIMENILVMLLEQHTISKIEIGDCVVSIQKEDMEKVIKWIED